jgi:hypothetical protein
MARESQCGQQAGLAWMVTWLPPNGEARLNAPCGGAA